MTDGERAEQAAKAFVLAEKEFAESLKEAKRLLKKADTAYIRALKACRKEK